MSTTIGALAVGSSVYMNVGGVRTEFLIVHQGLPSSLYDSSCDGTWLLMKDIYVSRAWDSTDNDYENSDIHAYLNGDFLDLFDDDIRSVIKQVKIPYTNGTGTSGSVASGSSGLSARVFLISYTEVGFSGSSEANVEGTVLSYFNGAENSKRIAYLNGAATYWRLRSPNAHGTNIAWGVNASGAAIGSSVTNSRGVRPALVLPSTLSVSDDNDVVVQPTNSAPTAPSSITSPSSVTAGDTITVSCGTATDPDGDAITYVFERAYNGGAWTVVQSSSARTFEETALESWTTVQYRVKAQDSEGNTSAYTTGDLITVVAVEEPEKPEVDEDLIEAIRNKAPQDVRLEFSNGDVIGTADIAITSGGLTYTEILNGETDVTFGRAVMSELSAVLINADGRFTGFDFSREFVAKIGVKVGGAFEYITLGVFKGQRPEKVRGKLIDFTAHDGMSLFDKSAESFADGLTFPCTLSEIFTKLCDFCGVGYVSSTFVNSGKTFTANPLEGTDYTCREILGKIAEAAGSYARMSRDGAVELVWFRTVDYTVTRTDRFEMTESEFETPPIDKLEVYNSYGDQLNTSGNGDIVYGISDNPFLYIENDTQLAGLQPYVDAIYNRITSLPAYQPSSFRAEFNPTIQCGDIISVVDDYDVTISFPVFVQTITWNGFGKTTYENTGGVIRQNAPFTQRELEQIKKKSLRATDLYTTIDSYLNTDEGVASITMAVSGKFMSAPPTYTYSTPSDVTYGFELTDDGYYTSTNAGVNSSFAYGVFTFENPSSEPREITLRCISYGENSYDFGIVSTLNKSLGKSNTADTSNVLKSFKDVGSASPADVTVTIPVGTSTISFKYIKDSSQHSNGDYFKIIPLTGEFVTEAEMSTKITQEVNALGASLALSVTNGTKSSTIALTKDGVALSSQTIQFTGEVVFKSDLSNAGSTTINGANITTGKISADRIDVGELATKRVIFNDDRYDFNIISSEIISSNNAVVTVGLTDYLASAGFGQYLNLYGTQIYMVHTGYDLAAGDSDNYSLTFDMANRRITSGSSSWSIGYFKSADDYNMFGDACLGTIYTARICCEGRICMGAWGETYPCLRYYNDELRWYTSASSYTTLAD